MKDMFPTFRAAAKWIRKDMFPTFRAAGRRARKPLRKAAKFAAVTILILFAVHSALLVVWSRQLNQKLAQIRATGAPVYATDLTPKTIPESENAAPLYKKATSILSIPLSQGDVDPTKDVKWLKESELIESFIKSEPGDKGRDALLRSAIQILTEKKAVFLILQQAVSRPKCIQPSKWADGYGVLLTHLSWLRQLTRVCCASASVNAEMSKTDAAVNDIILGLRISDSPKDEPSLISQLVCYACKANVVRTLAKVSQSTPIRPEQARRIYDELGRMSLQPYITRSLEGERACQNSLYAAIRTNSHTLEQLCASSEESPHFPKRSYPLVAFLYKPLSYKDQLIALNLWDKQLEFARLPYRVDTKARFANLGENTPKYAPVARYLFPVFSQAIAASVRAEANLGMAQTAMALEAFKSKYDAYPQTLEELKSRLGWKIPKDPFSGHSLLYKRAGKTFLLYSIGQDLKDDDRVPEDTSKQSGDVVWGKSSK